MSNEKIDLGRRKFLTTATSIVGGIGMACVAGPFLKSMLPSAKAQALGAPVEVDLTKLEEGAQLTVSWRGQPIWIVRRTKKMLEALEHHPLAELRDPDSDLPQQPLYAKNWHRSIQPEFLVLVGVCTHLGCVPTYRPDIGGIDAHWPGGFYCPCHGSKYDLSGRVYKGVPAPSNLVVPPHRFEQTNHIIIGVDQGAV